jgi:hypothetical protein
MRDCDESGTSPIGSMTSVSVTNAEVTSSTLRCFPQEGSVRPRHDASGMTTGRELIGNSFAC